MSSLKNELTHLFQKGISDGLVLEENPPQQGLKLMFEKMKEIEALGLRGKSTTTRIETLI